MIAEFLNRNNLSKILDQLCDVLPPGLPVYLVGGAVRDALNGRVSHDLDFVLARDALRNARKVADSLQAAYYPLDEDREYGRLVLQQPGGERLVLDFTAIQGDSLETDLRARDFTVNAMAVDIHSRNNLSDPLGGLVDLHARQLRPCSETSFTNDPVRILRGLRLAANLNFQLSPGTGTLMRQAIHLLPSVSPERLRDEFFRILDGAHPAACIHALELIGGLSYILPELSVMKNLPQSPPHIADVWQHTLAVITYLETVLNVLVAPYDSNLLTNLHLSLLSLHLGCYRQPIATHFQTSLNPNRSLRSLLFWAALFHDAGKPETYHLAEAGRIQFIDHEGQGEITLRKISRAFHLSNSEVDRAGVIVSSHLRPILLAQINGNPSRRAIYRFFRNIGVAGIDVCLLSLADVLGTYGSSIPEETWVKHLRVVQSLLEAWWERSTDSVSPDPVINGKDVMVEFSLGPGPQIGRILDAIKEAQAAGEVKTRAEAVEFTRVYLKTKG